MLKGNYIHVRQLRKNQDGLASILIVTVIISVVTLITLSFAGIIRREQRQALDQQLSAQARYAAESALNEIIAQYRDNPASLLSQDNCLPQEPTFSSGNEIQTTCVRVDLAPGPLEYDEVPMSESTIVWLDPGDTPLERLVITWQNTADVGTNSCLPSPYTVLPPNLNWDGSTATDRVGMLRFDLSRVGEESDTFSRASLTSDTFGGVLYPTNNSPVSTKTLGFSANDGPAIFGACGTAPAGVFTDGVEQHAAYAVIELPVPPAPQDPDFYRGSRYVFRFRSLYRNSAVRIVGFDTSDHVVEFADTQIAIEATARVNDVVQRVQIRLPAGTPPRQLIPDDAVHVAREGVCKLLETDPIFNSHSQCDNPAFVPAGPSPPPLPPADPPPVVTPPTPPSPPIFCWKNC